MAVVYINEGLEKPCEVDCLPCAEPFDELERPNGSVCDKGLHGGLVGDGKGLGKVTLPDLKDVPED